MTAYDEILDDIENLIRKLGSFSEFLLAVSAVCERKAEDLSKKKQKTEAKKWDRMSEMILDLLSEMRKELRY